MSWTDPSGHIWTAGEVLTGANMTLYIEANLAFLYGDASWNAASVLGFINSWVDFGGGHVACGYRLVGTRVFLRGGMKSGTINTTAFTLPVGYRPSGTMSFAATSNNASGTLAISTSGAVAPVAGNNASFFLDGISFDVL